MFHRVHVLNGPNLNLLGIREPQIYGRQTLADVEALCLAMTKRFELELVFRQTNAEHEMIAWLHEARQSAGIATRTSLKTSEPSSNCGELESSNW